MGPVWASALLYGKAKLTVSAAWLMLFFQPCSTSVSLWSLLGITYNIVVWTAITPIYQYLPCLHSYQFQVFVSMQYSWKLISHFLHFMFILVFSMASTVSLSLWLVIITDILDMVSGNVIFTGFISCHVLSLINHYHKPLSCDVCAIGSYLRIYSLIQLGQCNVLGLRWLCCAWARYTQYVLHVRFHPVNTTGWTKPFLPIGIQISLLYFILLVLGLGFPISWATL